MKRLFCILLLLTAVNSAQAKKIKFAVDMGTHTISPNGMHVMGDFQIPAGYSANFSPSITALTKEGTTTIYSIVLDVPAFKAYEFVFVNGIFGYEAEFVPTKARVDESGLGSDNRWLYVDSLTNDTTFLGAIQFGQSSPIGKKLIRYKVNMSNVSPINGSYGVRLGTNYLTTTLTPSSSRMCSFGNNVYEIIHYTTSTNLSYNFYNGNLTSMKETVPGSCSTGGLRTFTLNFDSVVPTVCFSGCLNTNCPVVIGVKENLKNLVNLKLFPNPANYAITIITNLSETYHLTLFDAAGKLINNFTNLTENNFTINTATLPEGNYHLRIMTESGLSNTQQIVILH